ncbi:hypothetical protein ZHAS_00009170 [Anopheles sinensis]|uniref:Uncharacterized protein n=1 Tax=Anopheles sinensis TaxID=74873 RepID=A0A084VUC5_ANOSI|nr:hypothetical protein ZHAS_00009170 [Anopheles sinensis]
MLIHAKVAFVTIYRPVRDEKFPSPPCLPTWLGTASYTIGQVYHSSAFSHA